jgi:hypothetical protein
MGSITASISARRRTLTIFFVTAAPLGAGGRSL